MKKANKKASDWMKRTGYLDTDDLTTIDYNNATGLADLETAEYNNDTRMFDLDIHLNTNKIYLKNSLGKQQAAKRIVKKYSNLKRKKPY